MNLCQIWRLCVWLLVSGHLSGMASEPAPAWPQRAVTLIVPFVAGGGTDTFARLLAPELSAAIGQPVLIENVVGAGGGIAARKLARAVPDGYVLMHGGISETVLIPLSGMSVGYLPQDLQAVSIIGSTPLVLATRKDFPARSLEAMFKLARSSPLKYTYGSSGEGSYGHLMFEAMARKQGVKLLHVPYKGSSQMLTDMASGHIDVTLTNLPSVVPYAKSHLVELLGVSAPQRLTDWPNLPTFAESLPLMQEPISIWGAVFAPSGLPPSTALKINAALTLALKNAALRAKVEQLGILLENPRSPSESQMFYARQVGQYQTPAR